MKLVLYTLIVFFGTLVAAGLVALGEPIDPAALFPAGTAAASTAPGETR